jgi:hypothetical protein
VVEDSRMRSVKLAKRLENNYSSEKLFLAEETKEEREEREPQEIPSGLPPISRQSLDGDRADAEDIL